MAEFLHSSTATLVLWLAVFAVLLAVGAYFVLWVRSWFRGDASGQSSASDMMTGFRELHARGEISDEEYRNIKTRLSGQLQNDINQEGS